MTAKVFIDGEAGTTGLQIRARLAPRDDIELLQLPDAARKDPARRAELLNAADVAILCLPDDAAREAVAMVENPRTRVIDASTAHRTHPDWVYGLPEYEPGHEARIGAARRVTNPGCYALASIALLHPLIQAGILPADHPLTINAVSGYTGGGKALIESFENRESPSYSDAAFRVYALGLQHKHVPEIQVRSGLTARPLFVPSVARFRQGMIVQIPLQLWAVPGAPKAADLQRVLARHYGGRRFVTVAEPAESQALAQLEPEGLNGTNELRLFVCANDRERQAVLVALLDNLGKGASGQAVQNLNLMLGLAETAGLEGTGGDEAACGSGARPRAIEG